MKIGILTYYSVHNHGSFLQAFALKKVLEGLGHSVTFLMYERNYDYLPKKEKNKYSISISSIPFYLNYLLKMGLSNIVFNIKKRVELNKFSRKKINTFEHYSTFNGDLVVIGSDEVLSLEVGYNDFFYGYGIKPLKISYAASFGPTELREILKKRKYDDIAEGLKRFKSISVRDYNSKLIIDEMVSKKVNIVCDPVILYGYKLEINNSLFFNNRNYIVIYSYDKNMNEKTEIEEIKKFAKNNNLEIISVGYHHKWCDKNINLDPFELFGCFSNSSLIITDTFHGAVLSLITNSNFVVKIRNNSNKLSFLMSEYKLENRILKSFSQLSDLYLETIDFACVEKLIDSKRKESLEFLVKELDD